MSKRPYSEKIKSALRNPYHLIAAAAVCSLSVAMLDVRPLLVGLAAEAVYLAIVLVIAAGVTIRVTDGETRRQMASPTPGAAPQAEAHSSPPPVTVIPPSMTAAEAGEMLPVRVEQLGHLDAAFRLIGMRLEGGQEALASLASGLTHLRDKFVLFARSEREHEQRLDRYVAVARDEEASIRDIPTTGQDAFAPSMRLLRENVQGVSGESGQGYRNLVRELLTRYDWQLREIGWQREQLPPGSESARELESHAESLLRRRKYADRAGTLLTSLHYEMELIVRKFETIGADLNTRQPQQILADIHALVIQSEAVSRSLREIEPNDHPRTRNGT